MTQAAIFRRLRYLLVRNGLSSALVNGKIRLFTMVATSLLVAAFVFAVSLYGANYLTQSQVPVKGLIVGGLFDTLFFTLGVMLVFSTGVILYASLFTAPEARFLLSTPARADRVFATKFQAAVGFSSWAFLILGVPVLVAYGLAAGVPLYYYGLLPLYLLGFVLLPGALSSLLALLFVRYAPRNRKQTLVWVGVVAVILLGVWLARVGTAARASLMSPKKNEVEGLINQFAFLSHPAAPSHWATEGVMSAARDDLTGALIPLALLWSNGLLVYLVAALAAKRLYRSAFDRASGSGGRKRVHRGTLADRVMAATVFYLDAPTRTLIVKDFRTFRRDPTQWVLLAIFGGLLVVGAANFRQVAKSDLASLDRYALSLINVSATAVLMCAGLSRFIFPLMSLEGRKFWILGLVPVSRDQILRGKFAFAATLSTGLALALILVSDAMIELPAAAALVHALTVVCAAVGLSGINVGLGAYLPNFRETDPSKIVVGFGGTVNMVVGLGFVLLVVGLMTGPVHAGAVVAKLRGGAAPGWVYAGLLPGLLATGVAVVVPLRVGARALRATEF